MPFHDKEWEELQRDCDIFPAYSDYLYGPDERLVVTQEPGLHPLVYPLHAPQPVLHANANKSSRTRSYKLVDTGLPNAHSVTLQSSSNNNNKANSNIRNDDIAHAIPKIDAQMASPVKPDLPLQRLRTVSEKEEARRLEMSQKRNRSQTKSTPTKNAGSKLARIATPKPQVRNSTEHSMYKVQQTSHPLRLHSSSAIDVKEEVAPAESDQKLAVPSTPDSTFSLPSQPSIPATTQQPGASLQHGSQISMLQPDDIARDPRYLCFHPQERDQIRNYLSTSWNIASHHLDSNERAKALLNIRSLSMILNDKIRQIEAGVIQPGNGQKAVNVPGVQVDLQPSYQHRSSPAFTPAQPALPCRTSHQIHQPSEPSPYNMDAKPPHPQLQQHQPQAPQEHRVSKSRSPARNQPQMLEHGTAVIPPDASAQLRANINRYIPQAWQCLVLANQRSDLATEADVQKRKRAQQWLMCFKNSLPPEGRTYMMHVVNWMHGERTAGRDPLASLASQPHILSSLVP